MSEGKFYELIERVKGSGTNIVHMVAFVSKLPINPFILFYAE
jgi:hypothetical protein